MRPCTFSLRGVDRVGLCHEVKTVEVDISGLDTLTGWPAKLARLAKPFEVDGWVHRSEDNCKHHRIGRADHTYQVTFTRYTTTPPPPEEP